MKKPVTAFLLASMLLAPMAYYVRPTLDWQRHPSSIETYENSFQSIWEKLNETKINSASKPITVFDSPSEILDLVAKTELILRNLSEEEADKARNHPMLRKIYLKAIKLLYMGRGNAQRSDGTGWNPTYQGNKGASQYIKEIIGREVLNEEMKKELMDFISEYDFTNEGNRINAGFPPKYDQYGDINYKQMLLSELSTVKVSDRTYQLESDNTIDQASRNLGEGSKIQELQDVLSRLEDNNEYKSLMKISERNFTIKSIERLSDEKFTGEYGREVELKQIAEALTLVEKGHVLLTGKAGVGKTTIIQMLSDSYTSGKIKTYNNKAPLMFELSITSLTNASDPSEIKNIIAMAKKMAKAIDREIILYVDEAHISTPLSRNALKSFLSERILSGENQVHLVLSTTSSEARTFLSDKAFSRRFVDVNVREFTNEESIALIKKVYLPLWKKKHPGFEQISDEAFEFAAKNAQIEQPHAGNPTGIKELLERTIAKMEYEGATSFTVKSEHIRQYLQENHSLELIPGDSELKVKFDKMWGEFSSEYVGQEGFKAEVKTEVFKHFAIPDKKNMTWWLLAGPPAAGKSYFPMVLADKFFNGSLLELSGGDYANGKSEINKLTGAPTGHSGAQDQLSVFTKFFADHPQGGVIVINEADYLHQDVIRLLTDMITSKKFRDGLGQEFDVSKYVLVFTTNIGQNLIINQNQANKMSWEQYLAKRAAIFQSAVIDGKKVEVVKPKIIEQVSEEFFHQIVSKSQPDQDTSLIATEVQKQKRRIKTYFLPSPTREELLLSAKRYLEHYLKAAKVQYGIEFKVSPETLERILDLDNYQFEKGHSYVVEQIDDKIIAYLALHAHERDKVIEVSAMPSTIEIEGVKYNSHDLVLSIDQNKVTYSLGARDNRDKNPWGSNPEMMKRIREFEYKMKSMIIGQNDQIRDTHEMLKLKSLDWGTRPVITMMGTSGTGKTHFFHSMGKALYDDDQSVFVISGLTHKFQLGNYFRPPTGVQGGTQETEFERWFKARRAAGGGVIVFDELMSFYGLEGKALSDRVEIINELYDLLEKGVLKIGNKTYDARGFIIGVTGNAFQELFEFATHYRKEHRSRGIGFMANISDETVKAVDNTLAIRQFIHSVSDDQIDTFLMHRYGIDKPKAARLGKKYLLGPLSQEQVLNITLLKMQQTALELINRIGKKVRFEIDPAAADIFFALGLHSKNDMRALDRRLKEMMSMPLVGIFSDLKEIQSIRLTSENNQLAWLVNGKRVILTEIQDKFGNTLSRGWIYQNGKLLKDLSPQLNTVLKANSATSCEDLMIKLLSGQK